MADSFFSIFQTLGLNSPLSRFFCVAALSLGIEFLVKPSFAFDEGGSPRPWAMPFGESAPGAVYTHWLFFPILLGLAAALFF